LPESGHRRCGGRKEKRGRSVKIPLLVVGIFLVLLGLHWFGQGTLLFPWPSNPAMDGHIEFVALGIVTALVGIGLIFYSRWKKVPGKVPTP
jgi:NADH:ubiquinone oxidoreductase subunit 3 (subunit A)